MSCFESLETSRSNLNHHAVLQLDNDAFIIWSPLTFVSFKLLLELGVQNSLLRLDEFLDELLLFAVFLWAS